MVRATNEGSIKSARRVIEILEYFDIGRQETSVSEVARELGYPLLHKPVRPAALRALLGALLRKQASNG